MNSTHHVNGKSQIKIALLRQPDRMYQMAASGLDEGKGSECPPSITIEELGPLRAIIAISFSITYNVFTSDGQKEKARFLTQRAKSLQFPLMSLQKWAERR